MSCLRIFGSKVVDDLFIADGGEFLLSKVSGPSFPGGGRKKIPVPFSKPDRLVARMRHGLGLELVLEESDFVRWPNESLPWPEGKSSGSGIVERWHLGGPCHDESVSRCLKEKKKKIPLRGLPLQMSLLLLRRRARNRHESFVLIPGRKHGPGLGTALAQEPVPQCVVVIYRQILLRLSDTALNDLEIIHHLGHPHRTCFIDWNLLAFIQACCGGKKKKINSDAKVLHPSAMGLDLDLLRDAVLLGIGGCL